MLANYYYGPREESGAKLGNLERVGGDLVREAGRDWVAAAP